MVLSDLQAGASHSDVSCNGVSFPSEYSAAVGEAAALASNLLPHHLPVFYQTLAITGEPGSKGWEEHEVGVKCSEVPHPNLKEVCTEK